MSSFGRNLKRLREARGLKATKLAQGLRVAPSVVSGWEHNRRGLPEASTLFRVAKAVGCSIDDLLADIDADYDAQIAAERLKLEQHWLATKKFLQQQFDVFEREGIPFIDEGEASPTRLTPDNEMPSLSGAGMADRTTGLYAVLLRGDSMEPVLKRGMRLIVVSTVPVADGDLAYAQLESGERFAKIATRESGGWLLSSANPTYAPRFVPNDQIERIHKVGFVRLLK
jgi:transcriptional regulator with XRE-family HTH domain